MEILKIKRSGLSIFHTGSLEPSQGSYDVPVALENDETYTDYTISMYVGYYVNGVLKKRKCETDSEGHYLIPGVAFLRSGIISISFLLETADKSQGLMTNALSYDVKHAPNVAVEVPPDQTWQELVKEWIEEISSKPTDEQVKKAVDDYIDEHGIETAGLTQEQIIALDNMFKVCVYIKEDVSSEYNAFKTAFGIGESGGDEPDTPINPTVTLTSITATYSGGDVLVGTDVDDLTGITVTGTYSDGSTKNIIDYTLSGTINEGSNIITVSYGDKTATFTVVGYVEETESTEPVYQLASPTTFDGTDYVDTGYDLFENDHDFTILLDFTSTTKGGCVMEYTIDASYALKVFLASGYFWDVYLHTKQIKDLHDASLGIKYVITHNVGNTDIDVQYVKDGTLTTKNLNSPGYLTLVGAKKSIILGKGFTGTIDDFKIYKRVLSQEEINTYLGV